MGITTILTAGNTTADSTDITVGVGEAITVGIFSAADGVLPTTAEIVLKKDTPGADNQIYKFTDVLRQRVIVSPGTYHVSRSAYAGTAFGVFTDDGA